MNGQAKWVAIGWLVVALLPLCAGAGLEDEVTRMSFPVQPTEPAKELHSNLEKANELIGAKVVNDKGQRLGTIEDIVLTPDCTAISYAAVSHGGLWGWGGKLHAIPWSQFEVNTWANTLTLRSVNPADIEKAKGFDKDRWPAAASENWLGRVVPSDSLSAARMSGDEGIYDEPARDFGEHRKHAEHERTGLAPDRRESPGVVGPTIAKADIRHRRLSELVGLTIKNYQGEELGELEDIAVDVREGRVAYAILSTASGFWGMSKELAAIPWSSFEVLPSLGTARLDADKRTLEAIAFHEDEFPNLEDPQYSRQLHERFGTRPYWEAMGYVPGEPEPADRPKSSEMKPSGDKMVRPWLEGSEYNAQYNPSTVKTIHGTIGSVGTFRLGGTSIEGLRLRVKTDDGKMMTVHAGPRPYVDSKKISFHYGDKVTVTGAPGKLGWRCVILASQIKRGEDTLDLRTPEGEPRWDAEDLRTNR